MCTIVYKLGGSLLSLPELSHQLRALLKQPFPFSARSKRGEPFDRLLVVGGGPVGDAVRHWDHVHDLGDDVAHRLAMQSMSFNAQLVAAILQDARVVTTRDEARGVWADGRVAVLAAAEFVDAEERATHAPLPRTWDVTSDSVAAYITLQWPADAMVLLKSVRLPAACDVKTAVSLGLLDASFPRFGGRVGEIGWANVRSDQPTIERCLNS